MLLLLVMLLAVTVTYRRSLAEAALRASHVADPIADPVADPFFPSDAKLIGFADVATPF